MYTYQHKKSSEYTHSRAHRDTSSERVMDALIYVLGYVFEHNFFIGWWFWGLNAEPHIVFSFTSYLHLKEKIYAY
jgi:hypothetical protein